MKDYYKDNNTFVKFEQVEGHHLDNKIQLSRMDGTVIESIKPKEMHVLYVSFYSGNAVEIKGRAIDNYELSFNEWLESREQRLCK